MVPSQPEPAGPPAHTGCTAGRQTLDLQPQQQTNSRGRNYSWAQLMRRVFAVDVLECPDCHGPIRILSAIHAPEAIKKILDCLSLPLGAPPIAPALPEREMDEPYLC